MMTAIEVSDFIDGKLGRRIEFRKDGDVRVFAIELSDDCIAKGFVPVAKTLSDCLFDIEVAFADSQLGVDFTRVGDHYVTTIQNRSDLNNTVGIAERHLEWHDYSKVSRSFDG